MFCQLLTERRKGKGDIMRKTRQMTQGFTLIELLMVVAILGILATIVIVKVTGQSENARVQTTRTQASTLKLAISQFEMEVGRLPKDLEELVYQGDDNWPGPFLDSETVPKDGWGFDFKMEKKGKLIRVTSPGPDGQFGTEDDLWK
jgi:general secretion pathway protein G